MIRFSSFKYINIVLLFVLFCFHTVIFLKWLSIDNRIPEVDEVLYLIKSLGFYKLVGKFDLNQFIQLSPDRPPLFLISPLIFYTIFNLSTDSAIMSNLIYLLILLFSTYYIGKKICNEKVGLLSAFMISFFPAIYIYYRTFYIEFALTAMITLSLYFLISANYFMNIKYSILFGISLALTALTKWSFIFFISAPLTFILLKSRVFKEKKSTINFFISMLLTILIAGSWYLLNLDYLLYIFSSYWHTRVLIADVSFSLNKNFLFNSPGLLELGPHYIYNILTYLYYLFLLPHQISIFYFFIFSIFLISIIYNFVIKKRLKNEILILLSLIVFSYFILTFLPIKDYRESLPILPTIAIFIASSINDLVNRFQKKLLIFLIVLVGLSQFIVNYNNFKGPQLTEFKIGEIINLIQNTTAKNISIAVDSLTDRRTSNGYLFVYYLSLRNINSYYLNLPWTNKGVYSELFKLDYLIIDETPFEYNFINKDQFKKIIDIFDFLDSSFMSSLRFVWISYFFEILINFFIFLENSLS